MYEPVSNYVLEELREQIPKISVRGEPESILLSCLYQELLSRVIEESKRFADRDSTKHITAEHLDEAVEALLGDVDRGADGAWP
ncbi:ACR199WAp [Eremothecium gossypii ATCC 10895]|uniref:ACR199WAp n=1 Tax=Eremothecium gossypii (strain ATCC 10895 / CBS 109.51 / FGSC 9923 / NRRL Y-1056) TaxID=284811 RepID=D8FGB2_EREGS|nr:ACR199WAp [Eremothecium gossypii ATCC 10895]ADJ41755.1 ACR199WAp [Eremothecium gossypii ATCC 10895]AEY95717.1 FACR199WAp [Eremothecium gossypii FDAG1]